MCDPILLAWLNLFVLALTLLVVASYTIITYRLHRTSQKQLIELTTQRRLSVIPTLLPQLMQHGTMHELNLTNIGNGVAVNIHIDKVEYASKELENTFYEFDDMPMLRPTDSAIPSFKCYFLGNIQDAKNGVVHLTKHADADTRIRITFQDLAGETYEEIFQMGKSGSKFISLNLTNKASA